jgi:hypothetical protein
LDNLLNNQHIDIINYLERVPPEYIPQKEELISEIKEKMQQANDPANLVAQLSPEEQQAFYSAPQEVQAQILASIQQPQSPM